MSYETGIKTLRLEPTDRLAHTEYCSNYALVRAVTGLDPHSDGEIAWRRFHDAWDIDLLWVTNDGPVEWDRRGRSTDMGHAGFLEGGIEGFYRLSLHHYRAWAKTSIEVFICHDDVVWSQGPFMHPDFYRQAVFPRYQRLWQVLHEAGKIVLYCSDGTWTQFVGDVAAAGADGFICEPTTSLDTIVERYGHTHAIVGSQVDCRTLTFGSREQIKREIDETLKIAKRCPGFMFAVGNHIPSNVPVENALFYFDYLRQRWRR